MRLVALRLDALRLRRRHLSNALAGLNFLHGRILARRRFRHLTAPEPTPSATKVDKGALDAIIRYRKSLQ